MNNIKINKINIINLLMIITFCSLFLDFFTLKAEAFINEKTEALIIYSNEASKPLPPGAPKFETLETFSIEETVEPELEINETEIYIAQYTDNLNYFAACIMAEAGNQDETGKRLVVDVILNRCDDNNCKAESIINAKGQFQCVSNGFINKVIPDEDIYTIIEEEINNRYDNNVYYFRTQKYHSFGQPLYQHGAHYFSAKS